MTRFCCLGHLIRLTNSTCLCITSLSLQTLPTKIQESNSMLLFDIKIAHEKNSVSSLVYGKPMFSGVFTDFDSFIQGWIDNCDITKRSQTLEHFLKNY